MSQLSYKGEIKYVGTWAMCHELMHDWFGHDIDNSEIV
jgi:hypothetical protein